MKCANCGGEVSPAALYCPNCGAETEGESSGGRSFAYVGFLFLGILAGIGLWLGLTFWGSFFFVSIGPPPRFDSAHEFSLSKGQAVYFTIVSAFSTLGLVLQLRARLPASMRAFGLGFFATMCGVFALCDFFAIPTLFDRTY